MSRGSFPTRACPFTPFAPHATTSETGAVLDGLLEVLAPDVWGDFDAGPDGPRAVVIRGADRVARNLLYYLGPGMTLVTQPVAGQPALLGFTGRTLSLVLILTVKAGRIQAMHGIGDPRKLGLLSAQLG